MPANNLIVLTFDSLAISPLGCYGGSWLATPGFNRLAAQSLIFDRMYVHSTDPHQVLRRYLSPLGSQPSVARVAAQRGMATLFFTDVARAAELPGAQDFDQCTLVETGFSGTGETSIARDIEDTASAQLLAAALARRETLEDLPHLLWIHGGSLDHLWDAPLALRESDDLDPEVLQADDDTEGDETGRELRAAFYANSPPNIRISEKDDPDLLLAWMAAYGAQIAVIDSLLEVLLDSEPDAATSIILASTGGFSLGQRGWVGAGDEIPLSSRLQIPLMISVPGIDPLRIGRPLRSDSLGPTLHEIIDPTISEDSLLRELEPVRWANSGDDLHRCLTIDDDLSAKPLSLKITPGWFYIGQPDGGEELYLKPDDRHDINNVASIRDDVCDELSLQ